MVFVTIREHLKGQTDYRTTRYIAVNALVDHHIDGTSVVFLTDPQEVRQGIVCSANVSQIMVPVGATIFIEAVPITWKG